MSGSYSGEFALVSEPSDEDASTYQVRVPDLGGCLRLGSEGPDQCPELDESLIARYPIGVDV